LLLPLAHAPDVRLIHFLHFLRGERAVCFRGVEAVAVAGEGGLQITWPVEILRAFPVLGEKGRKEGRKR
jgi:hypothetical protein